MLLKTNTLVRRTFYYYLAAQIITTIVSLGGIFVELEKDDKVLQDIIVEGLVQLIESLFYVWVILAVII